MNAVSPKPQAAAYECFEVTIEGGVAHIRLKRPEAMNSMIRAFWNELPAIVKDIDDNARARCIVISSTGKHFCSGMDLGGVRNRTGTTAARPALWRPTVIRRGRASADHVRYAAG